MRRFLLLPWVLLGMMFFARAQEPGPHPRLLMYAGEDYHEDYQVPPESMFARADSVIVAFSDAVLAEPPVTRDFIGRRLLGTSREAQRVQGLESRAFPGCRGNDNGRRDRL